MKKVVIVVIVIAATLPLVAQGGGNQGGTLGEVNALGQQVRRPPPPSGPAPRLPTGQIDLDGLWIGGGAVGDMERDGGLKPGEVPILPAARAIRDARKEQDDPYLYCMPQGVVRGQPYPWRFVQNYTHKAPTHLFKLEEGNIHSYRQIFMDGRKHPAELDPSWFGHSIGSWDGDTLVVDTVGFNDKFWFDRRGHPHTEQLHTIERFTRVNMGRMEIKTTVDDPGAYSKPWNARRNFTRSTTGFLRYQQICSVRENRRFEDNLAKPALTPK